MGETVKTDASPTGIIRRDFIAAGVGLLMPVIIRASKVNDSNDLHIGIIGTGAQGLVLIDSALKLPGIRFVAVCDIWEQWNRRRAVRILEKFGHKVNTYLDYRDMLEKERDLDAVIIATPDFCHHTHAIAALEAGCHVYCEKEMSNRLEHARAMAAKSKETGKLLQIGHQRRSNPRYRFAYEQVIKRAGLLGRMTTINAQWNRAVTPDLGYPRKYPVADNILRRYGYPNMHQFRNWRWYKAFGGGPIVDLGSHQIDIFSWFTGSHPAKVMAQGGTDYYDKKTHEWFDSVQTLWEYPAETGIVRAFYQTITTNSSQGYFETFMGDQGTLLISEATLRGAVYREVTNAETPVWDKWVEMGILRSTKKNLQTRGSDIRETVPAEEFKLNVSFDDPYHLPHLANFFNTVRGSEELNCPGEVGYQTAVAVLKVNEAAKKQQLLSFSREEFEV